MKSGHALISVLAVAFALAGCSGLQNEARGPLALEPMKPLSGWMLSPPRVRIFVQTPMGPELDSEWSTAAERALNLAVLAWSRQNGINARQMPRVTERDTLAWADWTALYQTVSGNAFFVANMDAADWRAGHGAPRYSMNPVPPFLATPALPSAMLFLTVSAMTANGAEQSPITQTLLSAGVVDTTNGDLLWLRSNTVTNGEDIRTEHGAVALLANLLAPLAKAAK